MKPSKEDRTMYAVIDIGSNTIRLVLYRMAEGRPRQILSSKASAGLAGYVQADGALSRAGIELCLDVLSEICTLIEAFKFDGVYPFATASLRNISNSGQVLDEIRQRCGLEVKLLTGREEAFYDYYGASRHLAARDGVLVDIGGGSTACSGEQVESFQSRRSEVLGEEFR